MDNVEESQEIEGLTFSLSHLNSKCGLHESEKTLLYVSLFITDMAEHWTHHGFIGQNTNGKKFSVCDGTLFPLFWFSYWTVFHWTVTCSSAALTQPHTSCSSWSSKECREVFLLKVGGLRLWNLSISCQPHGEKPDKATHAVIFLLLIVYT